MPGPLRARLKGNPLSEIQANSASWIFSQISVMAKTVKSGKSWKRGQERQPSKKVKKWNMKGSRKPQAVPRYHSALKALDPSTHAHLPGPRATAPYIVTRERINIPVTTNTSGQQTVVLLGSFVQGGFGTAGGEHLASTIAAYGVGTNVPGTTETRVQSVLFAGAEAMSATCSMHSMKVEVLCTGTSSGVVPQGLVHAGALSMPINRMSNFASWNKLANTLKTRRGIRQHTAYEMLSKPASYMTFPLDSLRHSEFLWMSGSSASTDELDRGLAPLVVILGPSSTAVDYTLTVSIEWKVRESLDPILQSAHRDHGITPEGLWNQLTRGLSAVGGFVGQAGEWAEAIQALTGAVQAGARALPALGN